MTRSNSSTINFPLCVSLPLFLLRHVRSYFSIIKYRVRNTYGEKRVVSVARGDRISTLARRFASGSPRTRTYRAQRHSRRVFRARLSVGSCARGALTYALRAPARPRGNARATRSAVHSNPGGRSAVAPSILDPRELRDARRSRDQLHARTT